MYHDMAFSNLLQNITFIKLVHSSNKGEFKFLHKQINHGTLMDPFIDG